jgi:hypothetical protein
MWVNKVSLKTSNLVLLGIIIVACLVFFFEIIPCPVENIDGIMNPDKFIYGGLYWTSLNYELSVGSYSSSLYFFSLFGFLIGSNHLFKKVGVYN